MKKNYLINYLVTIFIVSVLIIPVSAHSQELTPEQKQVRCQNNRDRIAELDKQLKMTNDTLAQIQEKKEMEDARSYLSYVRKFKNPNNPSIDPRNKWDKNFIKIKRIAVQYNFDLEKCMYQDFHEGEEPSYVPKFCYSELEKIIAKKIDKAVSLQSKRPELTNKKNEIVKQLATHRSRLITLDCDKQTNKPDKVREEEKNPLSRTLRLTAVHPPGDPYAGTYWIDIEVIQREGNLKGSGTWSNGATSNFTGTVSGGSVTLHRVDVSGFRGEFWGTVSEDGRMKGTGKNDPASPGGNNSTYTWTAIRK